MVALNILTQRAFFHSWKISHLPSPSYTPQHNVYAENRNRQIVETWLTLLHRASVPLSFWTHVLKQPLI